MRKFTLLSLLILCFIFQIGNAQTNPTRVWGTYYGTALVHPQAMAADKQGNIYVAGAIDSFPVQDAYLSKYNSAGQLLWTLNYGGPDIDWAYTVSCDFAGNVYIGGYTFSTTGIATTGSYQEQENGVSDAFLVKFDSNGVRQWGTYFGGSADYEEIHSIVVDPSGNIYAGGLTNSSDSISTPGAVQTAYGGGVGMEDAFLVKFNSTGARQWATYYGDIFWDVFTSLALDKAGNIYAAGRTPSLTHIATPGSHQEIAGGGNNDACLVKFTPDGQRVWGTYYGGNNDEYDVAIAYDSLTNSIYLGGTTSSTNNIATPGSFQGSSYTTSATEYTAYLAKFNTDGIRQWGTYYGGAGGLSNLPTGGLVCDPAGNIYLSLSTGNPLDIATPGAYQETKGTSDDAFLVKFNTMGNRLWGTYFGGSGGPLGNDANYGLTTDGKGNLYLTGATDNVMDIATPGSAMDAIDPNTIHPFPFLEKFYDCQPNPSINPLGTVSICAGDSMILQANNTTAQNYQWQRNDTDIAGATSSMLTVKASGNYRLVVSSGATCGDTSIVDTIIVHPTPSVAITANGHTFSAGNFATYQWNLDGQPIANATDSIYTYTQDGHYTVTITDANGCSATSAALPVSVKNVTLSNAIHIYPNPATDVLYVKAPIPVSLSVYSIEGALLLQANNAQAIEVRQLPAGVYMLKVNDEQGILIKADRFVKMK